MRQARAEGRTGEDLRAKCRDALRRGLPMPRQPLQISIGSTLAAWEAAEQYGGELPRNGRTAARPWRSWSSTRIPYAA